MKIDIDSEADVRLKLDLAEGGPVSYEVKGDFVPKTSKMLEGKHSVERTYHGDHNMLIDPQDCFEAIGVISLADDDRNCHTGGEYNSNNWFIEKGTFSGLEAYRVFPAKFRPRVGFGSRHCISFFLP